jgi:hypothetical protein
MPAAGVCMRMPAELHQSLDELGVLWTHRGSYY